MRYDKATLLNGFKSNEPDKLTFTPGGFFGHTEGNQRYSYETDPTGQLVGVRVTKRGLMAGKHSRVIEGRHEYYDFNF